MIFILLKIKILKNADGSLQFKLLKCFIFFATHAVNGEKYSVFVLSCLLLLLLLFYSIVVKVFNV